MGQRLRHAGPVQDIPQGPVGGGHIVQVRLDEHRGDAGLLLDAVHIVGDSVLGVAQVDDDLGPGVDERLHIQVGLAAVKLAEGGQIPDLLREIGHLGRAGTAGKPRQQVIGNGHQDHLGRGAAGCHPLDIGGDLHLPSGGVGDDPGLHPLQGVIALLFAAGGQGQTQAQGQE